MTRRAPARPGRQCRERIEALPSLNATSNPVVITRCPEMTRHTSGLCYHHRKADR